MEKEQVVWPSLYAPHLHASSLELLILSPALQHLSLVLHYRSISAPHCLLLPYLQMRCSACLRQRNRTVLDAAAQWRNRGGRMLQANTDWGKMTAGLGGGRAATLLVGSGERIGTGELWLLVPLPLTGVRISGAPSLSLSPACSVSPMCFFSLSLSAVSNPSHTFSVAQNRGFPIWCPP